MKQLSLLSLLMMTLVLSGFSQKTPTLTDKQAIIEAAQKEFEQSMKDGALKKFATDYNIVGEFYFDVTIGDKNKIVTIFAIGNDQDHIDNQNKVKSYLKTFTFSSFKVPKDKRYKFEQTFLFE